MAIGNTLLYQSGRFGSTRVTNPTSSSLTINFSATSGSEISFFVADHPDVFPVIRMPENTSTRHMPIEARLYRQGGNNALLSQRYFTDATAQLIVTNLVNGHSRTIPMENTGESFTTIVDNTVLGDTEFQVVVSVEGLSMASSVQTITLTNTPPTIVQPIEPSRILRQNNYVTLNLSDFFYDADGDTLSFEIFAATNDAGNAYNISASLETSGNSLERITLEGQILTIDASTRGNEDLMIHVSDGRGGITTHHVTFEVLPFWLYHGLAILIIAIIFLVLLSVYLLVTRHMKRPKSTETFVQPLVSTSRFADAKFEGYFLNTLSGREIPILNWNASYIGNKNRISLGEMFGMMEVEEKLPESNKMIFEAGGNQNVIFYHNTDSVVSISGRDIPRNKKEVLSYGNNMYIVFEDGSTEIEIRYKRTKRRT